MDAAAWDERYAASELVWSGGPNQWVVEVVTPLAPGRALDLAAGEGRNAIWLIERGWSVTAVDFSSVAVERMAKLAAERLGDRAAGLIPVVGDATEPQGTAMDLVLLSYLHLPEDQWRATLVAAVEACTPGGRVVVIGHARRNVTEGFGGPQDPDILYDPDRIAEQFEKLPVVVERSELAYRPVDTETGQRVALDTLVVARRV